MTVFAKAAPYEQLDGFIVAITDTSIAQRMVNLSACFARILAELASRDPVYGDTLSGHILRKGWQFSFTGLRMFISVFSPLYPGNHPRYSPDTTFILFQPEQSFADHAIGSGSRATDCLKEMIRSDFQKAGKPYLGDLVDRRIEAHLYILPRWPGDPEVSWWQQLQRR